MTNKIYSINNTWAKQLSAKYVYIIIQYGIRCNIIDVAIQLFFAH